MSQQYVSVVATVLNEAHSIEVLLRSLVTQTRLPDEIVIVDGGSTDGTLEKMLAFVGQVERSIQILSLPGANISQGRNYAIEHAQGTLIAVTDAGVTLEPNWLEELVRPFGEEGGEAPDVVSGFFVSRPQTLFQTVLGATTLPVLEEIRGRTFYPSSRSVAFRRDAWRAVGGYPEWLDYCEDLLFDFELSDRGYRFAFAPEALVHFEPRMCLRAFFKQYYRYARGDGKADFYRWRHAVRYATYLLFGPALAILALLHHPLWWVLFVAGQLVMMRGSWRRLRPHFGNMRLGERLGALVWLPIIRWTGDIAKMLGYPVGVVWRWRHAPAGTWAKRQS